MRQLLIAAFALLAPPAPAAEASWPDVRAELYAERPLNSGQTVIALDAPYRTDNDARTVIGVSLAAAPGLKLPR